MAATMAALAVVLEAYEIVQQANTIYADARDRIQKASRNPELAEKLASTLQRVLDDLAQLAQQCESNEFNLATDHVDFFNERINDIHAVIQETYAKLQAKIAKLNNRIYRLTRALTVNNWLSDIEASARRADELVLHITACFTNASLISKTTAAIEQLKDSVLAGNETGKDRDCFCPSFDVPENPPRVVLNFQMTQNDEKEFDSQTTVETGLKRALLPSDGSRNIGAVGSTLAFAVGLEGMSGVGKSCALRGLAKDSEIIERFRDGIYYMLLGKDASEANVIQQIAEVLRTSGGAQMASSVLENNKVLDSAVGKAKSWFAGRSILLLIDDVWEENAIGRDIVARLARTVDMSEGSRIVFTTRDVRLVVRSESISFSPRNAEVSLQILLSAAEMQENETDSFKATVQQVLRLCGGLPVALAVAGSAIKMRLRSASGSDRSEVWTEYLSGLQKHRERLVRLTVDNDAYKNLSWAFHSSLSMLDKTMTEKLYFVCVMLFSDMYRALDVLRRQGWVPVNVLKKLWETDDEYEAMDILQVLVDANLAQRDDRFVSGAKKAKTAGITLHDLQIDFVRDECKKYGEFGKWHRKLLSGYLPEKASKSSIGFVEYRGWSEDEVFKDDYIRNNVSRHLLRAGLGRELYQLLTNPQWAAKRLEVHESLGLQEDFILMLEIMEAADRTCMRPEKDGWALKMIANAARLSASYVSHNPEVVWSQLQARLLRRSEQSEVIKMYLTDISRFAERPWAKALTPCLAEAGGPLQSIAFCEDHVRWVSELDGSGKFFICCSGLRVVISTIVNGEVANTVVLFEEYEPGVSACSRFTYSYHEQKFRSLDGSVSVLHNPNDIIECNAISDALPSAGNAELGTDSDILTNTGSDGESSAGAASFHTSDESSFSTKTDEESLRGSVALGTDDERSFCTSADEESSAVDAALITHGGIMSLGSTNNQEVVKTVMIFEREDESCTSLILESEPDGDVDGQLSSASRRAAISSRSNLVAH